MTKEELLARAIYVSDRLQATGVDVDVQVGLLIEELANIIVEETPFDENALQEAAHAIANTPMIMETGQIFVPSNNTVN
jgi:hypothetical protein